MTFTYAGFWIRFVAVPLDGVILFAVSVVVQLLFAPMLRSGRMDVMLMALGIEYLIGMLIGATYEGVFVSRFGATPGKMALDLKVVRPDGSPISLGRAVGRFREDRERDHSGDRLYHGGIRLSKAGAA
ncbi:MAG TPA: RDD family protein [Bryobacteraceae bacterium]|nr:RDD family protein [Bryobacteraceae bacterium]